MKIKVKSKGFKGTTEDEQKKEDSSHLCEDNYTNAHSDADYVSP